MKINLAVYTATEGFDWQPGSVYSRSELNRYKEMIGRFPDILMEKVPYGGIFVCDGKLVFYRLHIAERGDSRGRDALYCVLGTMPLEAGRKVDLGKVFKMPQFSAPMRPFPVAVEVSESAPVKVPTTWEELQEGLNAPSSSAHIAVYATFFAHGRFFCRLDGSADNPMPKLTYDNCDLKPAHRADAKPSMSAGGVCAHSGAVAAERGGNSRAYSEYEKRLLLKELEIKRLAAQNQNQKTTIAILWTTVGILLLLGIAAMVLRGCASEPEEEMQSRIESIIEQKRMSAEQVKAQPAPPPSATNRKAMISDAKAAPATGLRISDARRNVDSLTKKSEKAKPQKQTSIPLNQQCVDDSPVRSPAKTNALVGQVSPKGESALDKHDTQECAKCKGTGKESVACSACKDRCGWISTSCDKCKGAGYISDYWGMWECDKCDRGELLVECSKCKRSGEVKAKCSACGGSGQINAGKVR